MKPIKSLFLVVGLLIAGAAIAATPEKFEKSKIESVVDETIDVAVDVVETYVFVDFVPVEVSTVSPDINTGAMHDGIKIEMVVWKDPEKLKPINWDAKRRTDFKLMNHKSVVKAQIYRQIHPPFRE
jgi:hypothetical protein